MRLCGQLILSIFLLSIALISPAHAVTSDRELFSNGLDHLRSNDPKQALVLFDQVIKEYPLNDFVSFYSGEAFLSLNDPVTAVSYFKKVPDDSVIYLDSQYKLTKCKILSDEKLSSKEQYGRSLYLYESGSFRDASLEFRKLVRNFPDSEEVANSYVYAGLSEYKRGSYPNAISYFKKGISAGSEIADLAYYRMGFSYGRSGELQAAINSFEKVIKYFPSSEYADDAQNFIAYYLEINGQQAAAMKNYGRLAYKYPNSDWADDVYWDLGQVYYKSGSYKAALNAFEKVAKMLPDTDKADECLFWQAKSLEKLGSKAKAKSIYEKLVQRYDHSYYSYRARKKLGLSLEFEPAYADENVVSLPRMDEMLALKFYDKAYNELSNYTDKASDDEIKGALKIYIPIFYEAGIYYDPLALAEYEINKFLKRGEKVSDDLVKLMYPEGYRDFVEKYAAIYNLDKYLVYAVIREESRFKPKANSSAQAYGLMQIIPSTGYGIAKHINIANFHPGKMYDPETNIRMGCFYLDNLSGRLGSRVLAIAGYNGGPGSAQRWWRNFGGKEFDDFVLSITYSETRWYVQKVLGSYYEYRRLYEGNLPPI
ncbi:MAG: tetratricopeptide repeat protein [bacterium]